MARQKKREIMVKKVILLMALALMGLVVIACGDTNVQSSLDTSTGQHPQNWIVSHRTAYFSTADQCRECHGADLHGGISKVSCFSASFDGFSCHLGGPSPHGLPFANPSQHGSSAKADLSSCQQCHGQPGTINFNGGLSSVACSACHTAANAHPTDWQGSGTYSHRNAGNRTTACAICHNVTAATPAGPNPNAPSCFSANFTNALGQARPCHAGGPGAAPHALPFADPSQHGSPAKADLSFCQQCHGRPGTISFNAGIAPTACTTCHTAANAHPTDWQGQGTYSHRTSGNRNVACAICHNVTAATPAGPNPAAPSCFSANFTNALGQARLCHAGGPGTIPHALPFADPSQHGSPAKADLSFCQECHGQPGTINFNGGLSVVPCSICHRPASAHPTDWQGQGTYSHRNSGNRSAACAICHNVTAATPAGPNPAAPSCFSASFTNALAQTRNCHAGGP